VLIATNVDREFVRRRSEGAEPEPKKSKTRRAPTQMLAEVSAWLPTAGTKDREKADSSAQARGCCSNRKLGQSGGAKIPNNVNELESLR